MRTGGGPAEVFDPIDDAGADRVQFHVVKRGLPMGVVEDTGVEASLPELSGAAFERVAISGVAAVNVHHEERDGIGLIAHRNQMEVIGHQGIGGDADGALLAVGFEQLQEVLAIGVAAEDALLVVAALDKVEPVSGGAKRAFRGKFEPPLISVFWRGKFS